MQKLSKKVSIAYKGEGAGKLEIEFYNHEDLDRILELIGEDKKGTL
jgi:ParB family chromosome partitioning protein